MEEENIEESTRLLKNKYDLHKAPEVNLAAKRTEIRTGESVSQNPLDLIQNYLNRFHEITDREDPQQRERGMEAIKRLLHSKYVIKPEEIPESYWENQRRIIRERGQEADFTHIDWEELKRQHSEAIIADQIASMDEWIDYLSSSDAPYPDALKYWTIRSVLSMGEYDKEKKQYRKRSTGTTNPFPELNREALAYVLDAVEKKYASKGLKEAQEDIEPEFEKLLQEENFAKLYIFAIEKVIPADEQDLKNTAGQWVKYDQGSDHMPLVASLQGHGTGWCTAGKLTAKKQLQNGDFYVYYSNDRYGKPTVPRVAIRMEEGRIAEVRGIAPKQNLDPYISPIVEQKLEEFPDGKSYQKKVADMKQLTEIDHKMQQGAPLDLSELIFLYEVESQIEGFGYSKDPRIEELRSQRNIEEDIKTIYGFDLQKPNKEALEFIYDVGNKPTPFPFLELTKNIQDKRNKEEDMPIIFGCNPSQIARSFTEINSNTKAYVGRLVPGIFDKLNTINVEHIYTSFPEGKIRRQQIEIGGKTKEQLLHELKQAGIVVSPSVESVMKSPDFTTLPKSQIIDTVRLRVRDLGFSDNPTTDQIYKKAQELGLNLCPPEVGPQYRLQYANRPLKKWFYVGTKQIVDSFGSPRLFSVGWDGGVLWLGLSWAEPNNHWNLDFDFIFSLPKSTT